DGHGSHTTLNWITLAQANNIILYCLPPHTTHRLQPLDVGCFGPLQTAWFNRCDDILDETGEPMEMKDVVREYFVARRKAFKSENIFQAWKKSGLHPLNPD
ncbi:CENP-B protein, partial [Phlegmacium glaucopus]